MVRHDADVRPRRPRRTHETDDRQRLADYASARERLVAAGVPLRANEQAREHYLELRRGWDERALALAEHYGYPCPPA